MSVWSGHDDIPPKNLDDLDGITLNIENSSNNCVTNNNESKTCNNSSMW